MGRLVGTCDRLVLLAGARCNERGGGLVRNDIVNHGLVISRLVNRHVLVGRLLGRGLYHDDGAGSSSGVTLAMPCMGVSVSTRLSETSSETSFFMTVPNPVRGKYAVRTHDACTISTM